MDARPFGHYLLEEMLGVGGMGEVWRARDTRRDRLVALKLLPEQLNRDHEFASRFRRESHVAARLREPHVIPIHDYGEIDGRLYIDMRLVDGRDLSRLLQDGPLSPERAVALVSQVADALEAAHADGLVHRDVKPSNVLVTPHDFVYVVDFGIARSIGSTRTSLTITGATVGTLDYMAPERFTDQPIDGRVDVYSLACVLAQCLTARRPFGGEDLPSLLYAHLYADPPRPSRLVAGIPPALDDVVARGMAKRPEDRHPGPRALVEEARAALKSTTTATVPNPPRVATAQVPSAQVPSAQVPSAQVPSAQVPSAPPPTAAIGLRSGDGAHSSVEQLPTVPAGRPPGEPPGPAGEPDGGGDPDRRPRPWPGRRLALVGALVLAVVAAGLTALLWPRDDGGQVTAAPETPSSTLAPEQYTPAPTPSAPPATSLAVPTQVGAPIPVRPTPGYLAVAPNGRYAYIAHRGEGVVSVLDTTSLSVTSTIPIDAAPPQYVAFSPDGSRAYVTAFNADYSVNVVVIVDTTTIEVLQTVPVGRRPYVPEPSPDGRLLYVPLHDEARVQVIDTATGQEAASYAVAANPHWIAVSDDGRQAWTANHESNVLSLLDLEAGGAVRREFPAGVSPHSVALSPDGSRVVVVSYDSSTVHLVDTATFAELDGTVGRRPQDVTWAPDGRRFYTADAESDTMSVVDAETLAVTASPPTGDGPTSVGVSPDGRRAYVTNLNSATVLVFDLAA